MRNTNEHFNLPVFTIIITVISMAFGMTIVTLNNETNSSSEVVEVDGCDFGCPFIACYIDKDFRYWYSKSDGIFDEIILSVQPITHKGTILLRNVDMEKLKGIFHQYYDGHKNKNGILSIELDDYYGFMFINHPETVIENDDYLQKVKNLFKETESKLREIF